MKGFQLLNRYDTILKCIKYSNTGTPKDFSDRLGICKSTLFSNIDYLRLHGAKIIYNRELRTYQYLPGSEVYMMYILGLRENDTIIKILGNCNLKDFR
jgi:hypothetical protein